MSEPIRVNEFVGGPLDGQEAVWGSDRQRVSDIQYALPTGATKMAKYRQVKGKILDREFTAYADNDLGRAEVMSLLAAKLIEIESLG